MRNSVQKLLDAARQPTLRSMAGWASVSLGLAQQWQQGHFQPNTHARARLVKEVRKHAHELLTLADAVEREGKET